MPVTASQCMRCKSLVLVVFCSATVAAESVLPVPSTDVNTGLAVDEAGQWRYVVAHCTSCHSPQLLVQQRLDRDGWSAAIRRMKNEGLWDLGEDEARIVEYLSTYYGRAAENSVSRLRRAPLAAGRIRSADKPVAVETVEPKSATELDPQRVESEPLEQQTKND